MPAASGSATDDVVMRLILKNQEPAEAARMHRMGIDAVRAEYAAGAQKIQEGFDRLYAAETAGAQKAAKEQIREAQQRTRSIASALKELEREHDRTTKSMSVNWHKTLEDMENVTVAGFGVKSMALEIGHGFAELAHKIIETSKVFGSMKQSIDAARESTGGTVKDIDLIKASNRAMEMGLELTGEEFGVVAAQANRFGDAVGIGSAEAMDKLIGKLASGSAEGLRHAGVVVDAQKEYEKLSTKLHVSTEKLTEEEKRMAIVSAAMEKMTDKFNSTGEEAEKFGSVLEKTFTQTANIWDRTLGRIGQMEFGSTAQNVAQYTSTLGAAVGLLNMAVTRMTESDNDRAIKKLQEGAKKAREENAKDRAEAVARGEFYEGGGYHGIAGSSREYTFEVGAETPKTPGFKGLTIVDKAIRDAVLKESALRDELRELNRDIYALLNDPFGYLDAKDDSDLSSYRAGGNHPRVGADAFSGGAGDAVQHVLDSLRQRVDDMEGIADDLHKLEAGFEGPEFRSANTLSGMANRGDLEANWRELGETPAQKNKRIDRESFNAELRGRLDEVARNNLMGNGGKSTQALLDEYEKAAKEGIAKLDAELKAEIDQSREKAGGGILGQVLFGDDTDLDHTYDKLSNAKRFAIDNLREISDAGGTMAGAIGQSLAASLGENSNFLKGLKERTHAILMALSSEAFTRAAMETAYGLASLALGPIGGVSASAHFAAAGAFAGVGILAGAGARATYSAPGAGAPSSSRSSPSFASGGGSRSGGGSSGGDAAVYITINGGFNTKDDMVRNLSAAMDELRRKTGRNPIAMA